MSSELEHLRRIGRRYASIRRQAEQLQEELVEAVLVATEGGATRREVAKAAGISFQRVQQIVEEAGP